MGRASLWELGCLLPRSIKPPHTLERCERQAAGPAREGALYPGERFPRLPAGAQTQAEARAPQQARAWEPPRRKGSHLGMFYANMHLAGLRVEEPGPEGSVPESRKLPEALDSTIKGNSTARLLGGLGEVTWGHGEASVSFSKERVWVRFLYELRHFRVLDNR